VENSSSVENSSRLIDFCNRTDAAILASITVVPWAAVSASSAYSVEMYELVR
jgi:hypothetical protein